MNALFKLILSALSVAVCGIPTWLFLFIKSAVAPVGFLQNAIVYGAGIYLLGGLQFVGILILIYALILIIASK